MKEKPGILILTTSFPLEGKTDAGHFIESECIWLASKNLRILVLTPSHPEKSSSPRHTPYEVRTFDYFVPRKLQRVAYGAGMSINIKSSLIAKLQLPIFFIAFLRTALKYSRDADIVHCHWFPAALIGAIISRKRRLKMVLTMHHAHNPSPVFKWILKRTDYLFCNSAYTAERTNSIFRVPDQSIIPLSIDTNKYRPASEEQCSNAFRILFVGRLIRLKGAEFVIRAVSRFTLKFPEIDIKLTIVGEGPLMDSLTELTKSLKLTSIVEFKAYIPNREMAGIYRDHDVLVLPSLILEGGESEGLGLVALEASACGIPVIGSNAGGIGEVIKDGETGYLVSPGNEEEIMEKISILCFDSRLRKKMGAAGRKRVMEKYTIEKAGELIFETYRKLL